MRCVIGDGPDYTIEPGAIEMTNECGRRANWADQTQCKNSLFAGCDDGGGGVGAVLDSLIETAYLQEARHRAALCARPPETSAEPASFSQISR